MARRTTTKVCVVQPLQLRAVQRRCVCTYYSFQRGDSCIRCTSKGPRICLGQQVSLIPFRVIKLLSAEYHRFSQFAYNEMTFFLVRFLQTFDRMELAFDAQPADARPPAEWARGTGRKAIEKIIPKSSFSLFVKVSGLGVVCPRILMLNPVSPGRPLDAVR